MIIIVRVILVGLIVKLVIVILVLVLIATVILVLVILVPVKIAKIILVVVKFYFAQMTTNVCGYFFHVFLFKCVSTDIEVDKLFGNSMTFLILFTESFRL